MSCITCAAAGAALGCKKAPAAGSDEAGAGKESAAGPNKDIPCKEDTNKQVVNGKLSRCLLTTDFAIDGYTCEAGKIVDLQPTGKLKGCSLKTAKVVDGTSCKDGLALFPSGKLRRCKATVARNIAAGVDLRAGDWVTFNEAGNIKRLELEPGPNKIQNLPCKGYLNYFHDNGKLKKCELSADATIEGKLVASKADGGSVSVCFDDKGKRVADCSLLTGAWD